MVDRLRELGDAISIWTRAAADTPENRKHIEEVRSGVNEMSRQAGEAFSSVATSDFGRQVSEGATQVGQAIGETATEFGQAAAPHVASAFAGLADAFGRAAHKVEESVTTPAGPPAPPEEPGAPAPAPAAPQPPVAPAPPEDPTGE